MSTKILGDLGEKIAEKYLKEKGYNILDKNFRYKKLGELDIIGQKGDNIYFFEVKARMKKRISDFKPEDNITLTKQKKLIKLSQLWIAKNLPAGGQDKINLAWQIDILAIEIYRDNSFDIRHLENAVSDFA
jgi:putative endonuclease